MDIKSCIWYTIILEWTLVEHQVGDVWGVDFSRGVVLFVDQMAWQRICFIHFLCIIWRLSLVQFWNIGKYCCNDAGFYHYIHCWMFVCMGIYKVRFIVCNHCHAPGMEFYTGICILERKHWKWNLDPFKTKSTDYSRIRDIFPDFLSADAWFYCFEFFAFAIQKQKRLTIDLVNLLRTGRDSNPRPPPWQGGILTNWTTDPS